MVEHELVICVGAEKAATTTLHSLMSKHPAVSVSEPKETGFFYNSELFEKGYLWYLNKFYKYEKQNNILFEADPNYMYFERCGKRIFSCNPATKIIVILRHPVERAISQYKMLKGWDMEKLSFADACKEESYRLNHGSDWERGHYGYIDRSMYASQIENILSIFPREQVLFVLFENFIKNQENEFIKIQKWLGLNVINTTVEKKNSEISSKYKFLGKLMYSYRFKNFRNLVLTLIGKERAGVIKSIVEKINREDLKNNNFVVSEKSYNDLMEGFSEDVFKVEKLTGMELSQWKNI